MWTAESRQPYKISAIQEATELLARSEKLVRELKARTRELKRSRRLSKNLARNLKAKRQAPGMNSCDTCSGIGVFIEDCAEPFFVIAKAPAM
jgi:hypothetical protein